MGEGAQTGLRLRHVEIHRTGSCDELEGAWRETGMKKRTCFNESNFLQVLWVEHCMQLVRTADDEYEFVVRTRPDVGILSPLRWGSISTDKVSTVSKIGCCGDWFFVMSKKMFEKWWNRVPWFYLEVGRVFGIQGLKQKGVEF